MPKVSIIMPVYNVEKYIHASINSVLNQTYKDYELILVDDGSPDACPQICDNYSDKYRYIHTIHKKNGGLSSARNAGVEMASGEYILFLDSDDTILPETLEKVVTKAEETGADVTIFGMHVTTSVDGVIVGEDLRNHDEAFFSSRDEVEKNFVKMNDELMWNHPVDKLYKKCIITDNNVRADSFYDRVCEDTVFLLDLFPYVNSICVVCGCYYEYAIRNTQSIVVSYLPDRYEKLYGRFKKTSKVMSGIKKEYRSDQLLYEMYCNFIVWSYEFMFHKDCRLSPLQRYSYIKRLFSIREEDARFCSEAECYYNTTQICQETSGTTRKVLHHILRQNYIMAWVYHMIALKRNKNNA